MREAECGGAEGQGRGSGGPKEGERGCLWWGKVGRAVLQVSVHLLSPSPLGSMDDVNQPPPLHFSA